MAHEKQNSSADLLIVGGGVIGLSLADCALRAGLRVTVLDKSVHGREASWAGAGMITCRPRPRVRAGVPDYHDLTLLSGALYPQWAARLLEDTGIDIGYRVTGAIELLGVSATTEDADAAELETNAASLLAGAEQRGVIARRISRAEIHSREPQAAVESCDSAIEFPDEAQVRNPWLVRALLASVKKRGGLLEQDATVADIALDASGERVVGVELSNGWRIAAPNTVICAGAWSGAFANLNRFVRACKKIHPVRGQLLCYQTDPALLSRMLTQLRHYIVPRGDGVLLVGATHEQAGFEKLTTPEGRAELTNFAHALLPALKALQPIQSWAGLRPGLSGRHPLLGPVRGVAGLFLACGHYRNGLTLAPATAELMTDVILGRTPALNIDGWTT